MGPGAKSGAMRYLKPALLFITIAVLAACGAMLPQNSPATQSSFRAKAAANPVASPHIPCVGPLCDSIGGPGYTPPPHPSAQSLH